MTEPRAATPPPIRTDPNPGALRSILHGLYDVAWLVAAVVGAPWLLWRSLRDRSFARMVVERAGLGLPRFRSDAPRVLVHGVSVGEVKVAVPLVRELARRFPDHEVVISTTTSSGVEVAGKVLDGVSVVRFPADLSFLVRRFLQRIRPVCVVLIELEIWPNFLRQANRRGIPVAVVNGRITENSYSQYLWFKRTLPQFNRISLFCVQAPQYADRFRALYVDARRVILTGNVKADGLEVGRVEPGEELRRLLAARPGQLLLVAGSTHQPEEEWVVDAWRTGVPDARLVLVPRHPARCRELARSLRAAGTAVQLLSELRAGVAAPDPDRPVLVDTIGELERVYGLSDLVFVGGTLIDHGGQNMLEPAAQGLPVVFGPSVSNFAQEAGLLVEAGACVQLEGREALAAELAHLAGSADLRARMATAGLEAVARQRGAAAATVQALGERCLA